MPDLIHFEKPDRSIKDFGWWPYPLFALGLEASVSFPFYFAPGWANEWPFGLTIYTVWSTWASAVVTVMFLSLVIGLGAAISALLVGRVGYRRTWAGFAIWLAIGAVSAGAFFILAFRVLYESTLEMWPNGYNP